MSQLPDFSPIFDKYEKLRNGVDSLFKQISSGYSDCVKCESGCSDCCHAMFDLSLVEAMYINRKFAEHFGFGPERSKILELADKADRQTFKFKRKIFKDSQEGRDSNEIMLEAAIERVRCPLLTDEGRCAMYEFRPLTCRIYGVPVNIGGHAHSCGKSGFTSGGQYPTVSLEAVNRHLQELSREINELAGASYSELHDVFVPLSMALLNKYDAEYLGIKKGGKTK